MPDSQNIEVVIYPRAGDGERPPLNYPSIAAAVLVLSIVLAAIGWWLSEPREDD